MSTHEPDPGHTSRPLTTRAIAVLLALLLGVVSAIGATISAAAATPGITSNLVLNGQTYNGVPVVNEGDTLTLRVQYDSTVQPGSTVTFTIGSGVTLTGVPATNTAIGAVTQNGNTVSITFKDPWPSDVNQGVFDLNLKVDNVVSSTEVPVTWAVDGEQQSVTVIVRHSGDQFANVGNGQNKSVSPNNLNSYVSVDGGQVTLDPRVANADLTYTLELDSATARTGFPITDQLPAGLSYVAGSFAGQLTSWDAKGLNRTTGAFPFSPTVSGNAFTSTVDVPGPSILKLTYTVHIDDVAGLRTQLQAQYDALGGAPGSFSIQLKNTATFGTGSASASVQLQGRVAGVSLGGAFSKDSDWNSKNVVTDAAGDLTPPVDITYTLKADLRQWTGANPNFTLSRNVVISDPLPAQAGWNTAASDFVTSSGLALTPAASCPAADAFAADAFVGQYCVSGQTLLINVGKDNTTNASIRVKAVVNTVAGLAQGGSTTVQDATPYRLRNAASYAYSNGAPYTANKDVTVVKMPDTSGGVNDSSVFTKTSKPEDATVAPGASATIDYTFSVSAGTGVDLRTSSIVDYLDQNVYGAVDPSTVRITGTYAGAALARTDFIASTDADGNLVIALSETGKGIVTSRGADKAFVAHIALTTLPFQGKESKSITNKATLFGAGDKPLYWSSTSSDVTSYGNEAEVRKTLYDGGTQSWVSELKAKTDGAGHLLNDTYVYRVEFIPHGSYNNVVIVPVADLLPSAVRFLGFVSAANAATAADPTDGPVDMGGNLIAGYDATTKTVSLQQKPGTLLQAGGAIAAYFAVQVTDISVPIVNKIGTSTATIDPIKTVSVGDRVWVDTNRDGRQDPAEPGIHGVVLTLTGPDGKPVTDVDGNPVGPTTTDADGNYTFGNLPALTGGQTYTVTVDQVASKAALANYVPTVPGVGDRAGDSSTGSASSLPGDLQHDGDRDSTLDFGFVTKTYAIGDYVWIDTNRDGVQNGDEKPLPGVGVRLLDDTGSVVATTTTDADGRYIFDQLPAGKYQVQFVLTDDQKSRYRFTTQNAGTNHAGDSDADPRTGLTRTIVLDDGNAALATDYRHADVLATQGIDATWDAGVVLTEAAPLPATPADPADPAGALAHTGTDVGPGILLAALAIVAGALAVAVAGLRRRGRVSD
ncbi:carboxypeptidase regulatory-like domain-containing protein [Leifsonia shinshuensis]|uniref:SdrD B-like domain-containing protein n=1 Tax=Leifsonia shinshuensis TaxID=150026 RepID=UPI001F5122E9|nr:SdrD B-like domain-containing protein [Leifsonia shinshuensis]MCI0158071.1 carboxypeptidase regulatory-like domain-containing protein [Leifsonia shinshuensis]